MKKYLLILLILVSAFLYSQKNYKISYEIDPNLKHFPKFPKTYATLYVVGENTQFFYERPKIRHREDNYGFIKEYRKYIFNYNTATKEAQAQHVLQEKDGLHLYGKWQHHIDWKITDETKEIEGYKAIKAVATAFNDDPNATWSDGTPSDKGQVIAWFAPEIPISAGPEGYVGLPGLIVLLNYEKASEIYKVTKIEPLSEGTYQFAPMDTTFDVGKDMVTYPHRPKDAKRLKEMKKEWKKKK